MTDPADRRLCPANRKLQLVLEAFRQGPCGDRIAENVVLNMARRDIAPGWRDVGGPALSVDRAWNVAQATPRYIAIHRDPAGQRFEGDPLERHVSQVAGPWPCTPPPPWDPPGNQSALLPQ